MLPSHTFVLIDHYYSRQSLSLLSRLFKKKLFYFTKNPIGLGTFSNFTRGSRAPSDENSFEKHFRKASEPNCRPNANEKFAFESKAPNKTRVLYWCRQFAKWFRNVMNDILKRGCHVSRSKPPWILSPWHKNRDSPASDHFWFWKTPRLSQL